MVEWPPKIPDNDGDNENFEINGFSDIWTAAKNEGSNVIFHFFRLCLFNYPLVCLNPFSWTS